jgi:hypothetical protein
MCKGRLRLASIRKPPRRVKRLHRVMKMIERHGKSILFFCDGACNTQLAGATQSRREDRPPPIRHARGSDRPSRPFPRASVRVGPDRDPTRCNCFARSLASPSLGILCCGGLYVAMAAAPQLSALRRFCASGCGLSRPQRRRLSFPECCRLMVGVGAKRKKAGARGRPALSWQLEVWGPEYFFRLLR